MTTRTYTIRVLLIGDNDIGKTSFAKTIADGVFPTYALIEKNREEACPVYETCQKSRTRVCDACYNIHIYDPQNMPETLSQSLSQVDICYLCFDVSNPTSFANVKKIWMPRVKNKLRPLILVGLRSQCSRRRLLPHIPLSPGNLHTFHRQMLQHCHVYLLLLSNFPGYLAIFHYFPGLRSDWQGDNSSVPQSPASPDSRPTCHGESAGQSERITCQEGRSLAAEIGASQYVETSSLKYLGIDEVKDRTVFDFIQRHTQDGYRKGRKLCVVM